MDDQFEAPRKSLLDVVQEKLQKQGKTVVLSRIVYAATLDSKAENKEDIQNLHETLFKKYRAEGESDHTGMLMVYPNCLVHVIEMQTKYTLAFLREVQNIPKSDKMYSSIKVISSTEDIPVRAYIKWLTSFMPAGTQDKYNATEEEQLVESASGVNLNMLKLGKQLSAMTPKDLESALSNPSSAYLELPTINQIMGLILSGGPPTLDEFLDIYDTPVDIDLDSENVWPMPIPITFE
mmetsp:Transcript_34448/g.47734  ORF Transcript_34448/g.47734 Transcript_34448/m.47734 type:complete len:236 (-) Transcript_34448:9-716(-)|eukprot:CAMPEP_0196582030 /NCGR_PEP_ID=MMETSP1081-20130531/37135_1 /TAXON_ID=36882 /ORGANISM="Pyramimonas amylifera, Strain CCMP720" /LENGTH=235 /DNA_ID=CAMNT_0041902493 /DNA_START=198 /DNA_END=905 /DNA_ORIENTATION=+